MTDQQFLELRKRCISEVVMIYLNTINCCVAEINEWNYEDFQGVEFNDDLVALSVNSVVEN